MADRLLTASDIERITRRVALAIALVLAVTVPLQYAVSGYLHNKRVMEQVGYNATNALLRHIYLNPETWSYQEHRLHETLNWVLLDKSGMSIQASDARGKPLAQAGNESLGKALVASFDVVDGGRTAARVEIRHAVTPLAVETLVVALLGLIPALLFYFGLKILPFRLLETAWSRLRRYQGQLREEIDEKQFALRRLHEAQHRMEFLALQDPLTGLANRSLLRRQAELMLALARRQQQPAALFLIDLDDFTGINSSHGRETGDRVLRVLGQRLQRMVRDTDVVARLGGDEFAVLMGNASETAVENMAQRLLTLAERPVATEAATFNVGASVGLAWFPRDGAGFPALLRCASLAQRQALQSGDRYHEYRPASASVAAAQDLPEALSRAIRDKRFQVLYQPMAALEDRTLVAVEATLFWRDERFGVVDPADFIPLADSQGQIPTLVEQLLDEALGQLERWRFLHPDLRLCVGLPPSLLGDTQLAHRVAQLLKRHGMPAECLVFAVSEDALLLDPLGGRDRLGQLRELGAKLLLDRFGSGYSSVCGLSTIGFDTLRIDAGFIESMGQTDWAGRVVETAIGVARAMNAKVAASGIDTLEQWRTLQLAGCDLAQGLLISPARRAPDLTHVIGEPQMLLGSKRISGHPAAG